MSNLRMMLLHGFAGHAQSWNAVRALLPHASEALTLPGHDFAKPMRERTFQDVVDSISRVITDDVHLVGYSLGGRVALGVLLQQPRVVRATLIGVHPGLQDKTERLQQDAQWSALLRERGLEAFLDAWERQPIFASQQRFPTLIEQQRQMRLQHDAYALAQAMDVMSLGAMPNYTARLSDIEIPVQLIAGALDKKFTQLAASMHERLRHSTLHILPDCGHNPLIEAPRALAECLMLPPMATL